MEAAPQESLTEESLSSGMQRQVDVITNMQQELGNLHADFSKIQALCQRSKAEHTRLTQENAEKEMERARLVAEIERRQNDIAALEIEYAGLKEDEQWWRQADATASAELEQQGKITRQLWVKTERIKELEAQRRDIQAKHEEAIATERAVATGLRERISRLERKIRSGSGLTDAGEGAEADLRAEVQRLQDSLADSRDSTAKCTRERDDARAQAATLTSELAAAKEEAARLRREAERRELRPPSTPPRALQALSPNVRSTPRTPSKSPLPGSPKLGTAQSYAHLESQHRSLKQAYDNLRTKYSADIQHWREYKKVDQARKELKAKKREERKATQLAASGAAGQGDTTTAAEGLGDATTGPAIPVREDSPGLRMPSESPPLEEVDRTRKRSTERPIAPRAGLRSSTRALDEALRIPSNSPPQELEAPPAQRPRSVSPSKQDATVTPASSRTLKRVPSVVTPWLGTSSSKTATPVATSTKTPTPAAQPRHRPRTSVDQGDDAFDTPSAEPSSSRAPDHTPLVRDRTGGVGRASSLRRAALQRSAVTPGTDDSPATPGASSTKRKRLDMEGLSPAEKAAELKKIAKLPASERRELYAGYKTGGRYMPPEAIQRGVAAEYEIDPEKNAGVAHQFDEVVRGRDARKRMHGGDCECCRDYYEAVGPLPRFNAGPVWKDTEDDEADSPTKRQRQLEDHQNRISRHREVWRKPPTPPDFWKIGFPSTQDVEAANAKADKMVADREAEIRRQAAHKDSKWRKKQ